MITGLSDDVLHRSKEGISSHLHKRYLWISVVRKPLRNREISISSDHKHHIVEF